MKIKDIIQYLSTLDTELDNVEPDGVGDSVPEDVAEKEMGDTGEVEEEPQIDPQTNGKVTDPIPDGTEVGQGNTTVFEDGSGSVTTTAMDGNTLQVDAANSEDIKLIKIELDKMKVTMAEILTRIELVSDVTEKVVLTDHDSLLTESIKLLV